MEKLKPCPFCGKEPELVEGQFGDWYVICPLKNNCGVHPTTIVQGDKTVNTKKEAIKKWSIRTK